MLDPNNLPHHVVRALTLMHAGVAVEINPLKTLLLAVWMGVVTHEEAESIVDLLGKRIEMLEYSDDAAVKDMLAGAEAYLREQSQ